MAASQRDKHFDRPRAVSRGWSFLLIGLFLVGWGTVRGFAQSQAVRVADYFEPAREMIEQEEWTRAIDLMTREMDRRAIPARELAVAHLTRGSLYFRIGQLESALEDLNQAITLDPQPRAYALRGQILLRQGRATRAYDDFNRALRMDQDVIDAWLGRAAVYYLRRDHERAAADYDRALALNPEDRDALNGRAQIFVERGQYAEALQLQRRAHQGDPEHAQTTMMLARTLHYLGEPREALNVLEQLPEEHREAGMFYLIRANIYIALRKFESAEADMERGQQNETANPFSLAYNAGVLALQQRRWDGAIRSFTQALEINRHSGQAYLQRGEAYRMASDVTAALADFERARRYMPRHAQPVFMMAATFQQMGRPERAMALYTEALTLDATHGESYLHRGNLLMARGAWDAAQADFEQAAAHRPQWIDPFIQMARIHIGRGQHREARAWIRQAEELDPEHADIPPLKGQILFGLSAYEDVVEVLTPVLDSEQATPDLWLLRARAYDAMGESALADQDRERARAANP